MQFHITWLIYFQVRLLLFIGTFNQARAVLGPILDLNWVDNPKYFGGHYFPFVICTYVWSTSEAFSLSSPAVRCIELLASQRECSLSAIEYCNPPYLDLPFKMIEVSHKERSDCVSAFIKSVKHPGLNPTFKCFSFLCPPAGEEEKQSEKILNAIAASAKHIMNSIICDVQDRFLYSNDLLNGHLKRSESFCQ